jgi:hypothetical protein
MKRRTAPPRPAKNFADSAEFKPRPAEILRLLMAKGWIIQNAMAATAIQLSLGWRIVTPTAMTSDSQMAATIPLTRSSGVATLDVDLEVLEAKGPRGHDHRKDIR